MKATLELPDALFRKAKATAAREGRTLAGGLKHLHAENLRIDRLVATEFGQIEPEDRR